MTLKLIGIVKRFASKTKEFRLEIDNLVFEDNRYYVILGPSGSGKTTTLRVISGLETPDAGKIFLDNEDITWLPPWKRNIGIVFQNYALYPHLTAFENIAVPLKVKKVPNNIIEKKVNEIARILEIDELLDHRPSELSGGQQQRVALARALVKEPKILLLDEPLSNLDARVRIDIRGFLKELQRRLKMTVIHVTHDQEEAMAIADEIILINNGKIFEKNSPDNIYKHPKTLFAFKFIGLSNVVSSDLIGLEDCDYIGFRPEDTEIVEESGDIEGIVRTVQNFGSHKIVEVAVNSNTIIKIRVSPDKIINDGQKIYIKIKKYLKFKDEVSIEQVM